MAFLMTGRSNCSGVWRLFLAGSFREKCGRAARYGVCWQLTLGCGAFSGSGVSWELAQGARRLPADSPRGLGHSENPFYGFVTNTGTWHYLPEGTTDTITIGPVCPNRGARTPSAAGFAGVDVRS